MYINANQSQVIEAELAAPAPRNFRFTTMTQFSRGLGLTTWIVITVALFYCASRHITMLDGLLTTGKVTNATVDGRWIDSDKSTSYHLRYEYRVDGAYYEDKETVSRNEYEDTDIGSRIVITYLPSDPAVDRPGRVTLDLIQSIKQNWVIGIGAFCTLYGIGFALGENYYKKRLVLAQYGAPARARVTSKDHRSNGKSTTYTVSYSFTADGKPIWQTKSVPLTFFQRVNTGDDITVLYMPANPMDSVPYRAITEVEVSPPIA